MEQNSIRDIINKAVVANRSNDYKYEKELTNNLIQAIRENIKLFESTNEIDLSNNNGFKIDFDIIDRILNRYLNSTPLINTNKEMIITKDNLLNSKLYTKLGIILVLFDGNTYTLLEMILLGILTHNTIIFSYDGYMLGTNGFLINMVESLLENEGLNKEMFQQISINAKDIFNNFKTINKTVLIGDNEFINKYLKKCSTDVIVSGYNNYDIYVDNTRHIDVIKNILAQDLNINLYIKVDLNIDFDDAIVVNDIDEAITYINYNSSKYSSAIFTEDNDSATKFIRNIDSKFVMVNASPTLEQQLDIKQEDLLKEKNIIMPNIYKFDGTSNKIEIQN